VGRKVRAWRKLWMGEVLWAGAAGDVDDEAGR